MRVAGGRVQRDVLPRVQQPVLVRTQAHSYRQAPQQTPASATAGVTTSLASADPQTPQLSPDSSIRPEDAARGPVLVDRLVVQPAYRSTPWEAETQRAAAAQEKALLMFVSESGICRGPLAAAAFQQLLQHSLLRDYVSVTLRATQDFCVGQEPHPAAAAAADRLGFCLSNPATSTRCGAPPGSTNSSSTYSSSGTSSDSGHAGGAGDSSGVSEAAGAEGVEVFDPAADIVCADLVLVMDKYTAADVLREVSAYDLMNPGGHYSSRVRLLGSFHPHLASQTQTLDDQGIDDALYGNVGGEEEEEAVLAAAKLIVESCRSLLQELENLAWSNGLLGTPNTSNTPACDNTSSSSSNSSSAADGSSKAAAFKALLIQEVRKEGTISWLVPPMLQGGSGVDVEGWV